MAGYDSIAGFIEREEGRYIFLSQDIYPRLLDEASFLSFAGRLLGLPDFYAHFGGAGDSLLLLSGFYDRRPDAVIVSLPNSAAVMRKFFDAFPLLRNVIFFPPPEDLIHSVVLRQLAANLRNCLGMGITPSGNYAEEWNSELDIFTRYGVDPCPAWAQKFKGKKLLPFQVALAPKGSGFSMNRNIIPPGEWPELLDFLRAAGISPVILGTPDEADAYPANEDCLDKRSFSFAEQMEIIASSELLIAADSWHKSFAALAGVPALVFRPDLDEAMRNFTNISGFVFLTPWPTITILDGLPDLMRRLPDTLLRIYSGLRAGSSPKALP